RLGRPLAGRGGRAAQAIRPRTPTDPGQDRGPGAAPTTGDPAMSLLELHDVSKVYGEGPGQVIALDHVSIEVDRGSLVAVMGPSGSGKSTLLTIAGTLEDASTGRVIIDGHDVAHLSRNDKARLRLRTIGFVFQDFNLPPGLTAVENVSLP